MAAVCMATYAAVHMKLNKGKGMFEHFLYTPTNPLVVTLMVLKNDQLPYPLLLKSIIIVFLCKLHG